MFPIATAADGRVVISTQLDNDGFTKGIASLKGQLLGGLKSVVGKLGGVIASAFAIKAVVNFGKECVELGSNVAEVQNVVDTAFGDMSYKVEAFAETAIENFGISTLAAKETASTYMAMAKGMGLTDEAASDMAISLAGLTGDVASFYNISQGLADTKLKSVFTGETETLKDLGVVMTQANLEAYALQKGITKSYEAMTQAEKVALRYNYVMDTLSMAQGDFAKTSDSWANQTRILSMQWEEFMSIIGQSLTKILLPCVKVLNTIVSALISVANAFSATLSSVFGGVGGQLKQAASSASEIGDATAGAVENQDDLTAAVEETAKASENAVAGFDEINKLSGDTAGASVGGVSAEAGAIATFEVDEVSAEATSGTIKWLEDVLTRLQETAGKLDFTNLSTAFDNLKTSISPLVEIIVNGLGWAYDNVLEPFLLWSVDSALPAVFDLIAAAVGLLVAVLERLQPVGRWLWDNFLQPLTSWAGDTFIWALEEITDLLTDLTDLISGNTTFSDFIADLSPAQTAFMGIATAFTAIKAASMGITGFSTITSFVASVKTLGATSLLGKLAEVFTLTASGAGTLGEAMAAVFGPGSIVAGIGTVIAGAVTAITSFISMLENGFSWVKEALMVVGVAIAAVGAVILGAPALVAGVVAAIVAAIGTAVVLIKEHWESIKTFFVELWASIKEVFGNVAEWFREKFTAAWQAVKDVFSTGGKIFDGIKEGVLSGLKAVVNAIIDGINKVIAVPFNGLNTALTKIKSIEILGLKPFSWIDNIKVPKIPRLATGSVIPPNREFLAVLGDNKTETEVVSPLSTMKQAMLEAMQEAGASGGGTYTFVVNLDGKEVARNQVKHINNMTRQAGKPVLLV